MSLQATTDGIICRTYYLFNINCTIDLTNIIHCFKIYLFANYGKLLYVVRTNQEAVNLLVAFN